MKVKKAVIPAAGLGTRFLPVTKSVPKEMLPIVDKPTIQYIIEEIVDSGIQEILIITGRNKDIITNHFDNVPELEFNLKMKGKTEELRMIEDITNMARIFTVRQKEAKGLGSAPRSLWAMSPLPWCWGTILSTTRKSLLSSR